ncbi:MAG: N-acetyltransferase [Glaciihabitans sp.]|nr:N-acetyltransferase [Glaciihabitans sp.]
MASQRLPNAVHRRERQLDSGHWEARLWLTDEYPDGTDLTGVAGSEPRPDWVDAWHIGETPHGILQVEFAVFETPDAPNVWFVNVDEPRAKPAATNLVAFVGDEVPPGTIVSRYAFATMGVSNDNQVAAVRWYPDGGLIHQIFVAPAWRRKQLATRISYMANAFHIANNWPGVVHGDGRRTLLGEFFTLSTSWPNRYRPLEIEMPPMDEVAG